MYASNNNYRVLGLYSSPKAWPFQRPGKSLMEMTVSQLAKKIAATLQGDGSLIITGCASLEEAGPSDLSFLSNRKYIERLKTTKAGAVVLSPQDAAASNCPAVLVADDPYFAFRQALVELVGFRNQPGPGPGGVSDQAVVAASASLGQKCYVGPFAVIDQRASIGRGCVIYPHCHIGPDAIIGDDCILYPNVTVYDRCELGSRVILHAGCSIGQDGFGYATHSGAHHKIPPGGCAIVEDDVEMGANCSVDRATVGATIIGAGTKFSNSVTIGHGTRIGTHNLFVAQVGVAGSVVTGAYVVIGGQTGVAGHLKIADGVQIAAQAGVMHNLTEPGQYGGQPARKLAIAKRQWINIHRLADMANEIKKLTKRVAELEAPKDKQP